jgi:sec-independent protein translocase protein TatB
MFDIGWSEMAVVALIALVVMGPKELPRLMRSLAKWTHKARSMAREFQSGIDDMVREADLDDARKAIESAKSLDVGKKIEETIDPTGGLRDEASSLKSEMAREAAEIEATDKAGADDAATDDAATDDAGTEDAAAGDAEKSPEEIAANASAGALGIGHPDDIVPPEPEPEPAAAATATAAADSDSTKQPA